MDEKSYENLLIYEVLYKTLISVKALSVVFDKVYRFITDYDGNKYLVLFRPEKHNVIFDRIGYVIGMKSGATYVFSHNYTKIKIYSDDDLNLEKGLTMHHVVILVKLVFN